MDELEALKKRVDELEALVKALLSGDERAVHLTGMPVGNLVLGQGCQVTMNDCPTGTVFFGDQDAVDGAEARLDDLAAQAEVVADMLDDLESRLDDLENRADDADQ